VTRAKNVGIGSSIEADFREKGFYLTYTPHASSYAYAPFVESGEKLKWNVKQAVHDYNLLDLSI
jgi:hypothetical protein